MLPQAKVATTFATTQNNKAGFYTTSLKLPTLSGNALAEFATATIKKDEVGGLAEWMKQNYTKTKPRVENFYQLEPHVSMTTPNLISLYFIVSTYEGGAHPMYVFDPYTFAMVNGKPVQVHAKDLFQPSVQFVDVVSSLVMSKLAQDPRAEWVKDGTVKALTPGQVDSFVVTPTTLTYLFNPYDMGPYAVGSFQIKVPFSELSSDLNPQGPLAPLLK